MGPEETSTARDGQGTPVTDDGAGVVKDQLCSHEIVKHITSRGSNCSKTSLRCLLEDGAVPELFFRLTTAGYLYVRVGWSGSVGQSTILPNGYGFSQLEAPWLHRRGKNGIDTSYQFIGGGGTDVVVETSGTHNVPRVIEYFGNDCAMKKIDLKNRAACVEHYREGLIAKRDINKDTAMGMAPRYTASGGSFPRFISFVARLAGKPNDPGITRSSMANAAAKLSKPRRVTRNGRI
ncbi:hypothetical protein B0H14DRAFT_2610746 [Mycena olivaceomarginata]|nr:hypothetical protein B0H14DRAFT_2610746 [Mycena olivaceomarginata]